MLNSKIFRLVLAGLLTTTIALESPSQTSDTICLQRKDVVKLLTKAEEGKLLSQKVSALESEVQLINGRVALKESIIKALGQKDANNDSLINNYKQEILIMKDQRKIFEGQITYLEKQVKRYKRRLFWRTTAAGTIITATAILYITK